jgi:hypothetical protein
VLQIQALFPEGGAITINWFGDYEDQPHIGDPDRKERRLSIASATISSPRPHTLHATGQMARDREGYEGPSSRGTTDFNDS